MSKAIIVIVTAITMTGFMVSNAMACNCGKKKKDASSMSCQCGTDSCGVMTDMKVKDAKKANNVICPVSGKPIGSMGEGVSYTHNGKTYKLCCSGCIKPFKGKS